MGREEKKLFAEEPQWEKERMLPGRKEMLFIFLTEGQNWPFIELLGAPAILLGAPSISQRGIRIRMGPQR